MQSMLEFGGWDFWPCMTVIAVGTVAFSVIPSIATQWRKTRIAQAEAGLKAQMVDRGMSVDEIERVLAAGKRPGRGDE